MRQKTLRDTRVRSVEWKDLTYLSSGEIVKELVLSLPWLAASLWLAHAGWYFLALPASFMFFLVGLRQVHNAYHYALGLSRRGSDWVMFALSVLMLGSMHAVQINHLEHHLHCLDENDVEGASARMPAWKAVLLGPLFPIRLHANAWKKARSASFHWIVAELADNCRTWCSRLCHRSPMVSLSRSGDGSRTMPHVILRRLDCPPRLR